MNAFYVEQIYSQAFFFLRLPLASLTKNYYMSTVHRYWAWSGCSYSWEYGSHSAQRGRIHYLRIRNQNEELGEMK